MLATERVRRIREMLLEYKHVDINTLCSLLSVSMATVRRDLEKLEMEGFLNKVHGGAVLNDMVNFEVILSDSEDEHANEKVQIGRIAAEMILDNDIVFLGVGNTCLAIAKSLRDKQKVTVITNNINIVIELAPFPNIKVVVLGGDLEVLGNSLGISGQYTIENVEKMYINKTFLSVDGISLTHGYTVNSKDQGEVYKLLLKNSNDTILVADYSKFGKRAFAQVGEINAFEKIVTDINIDIEFKEFYYDNGVKVFITIEDLD